MHKGETMQMSDAQYAEDMDNDYHRNRLALARGLLGSVSGASVFDFGCGDGAFMGILANEGAKVSGCDPSQTLIDKAPAGAKVGGVETLEALPPGCVDVLLVLNVLSYMPGDEQIRFWPAARSCLKTGGVMLQSNPNNLAASTKQYQFTANPRSFPAVLASHGFRETRRDFHRFRLPSILHPVLGRDIVSRRVQRMIPTLQRAARSTVYISLAEAV